MLHGPISVDSELVDSHAGRVSIVRCGPQVDVVRLRDVVAAMGESTDLVALLAEGEQRDAIFEMTRHPVPVATSAPVTDALKRLTGDRVAKSVDRSSVVKAGLPMLLDRDRLRIRLETITAASAPVGLLLDPEDQVTLLGPAELHRSG